MRKNTARHWLHAILDLLPVLIIPIFALQVRSDNGYQPISIDYKHDKVVNFNQLIALPTNITTNTSYSTFTYNNETITVDVTVNNTGRVWQSGLRSQSVSYIQGHKYLVTFSTTYTGSLYTEFDGGITEITNVGYERYFLQTRTNQSSSGLIGLGTSQTGTFDVINLNMFDLTYIFGEGNEPSYAEFRDYFAEFYYPHTLNQRVLITDYTETLNDTDVGSQVIYTLYNAVDKYFNMGNVFNLGNVYQWFVINIFGGSSPIALYIVWNIVLYEFVMDLLFLLYGLFMWFIDMCKRLMDKPLDSIK